MMHELSIREVRNALGHLDEYLAENGEMIITRHGKRIARILPLHEDISRPTHDDLRAKMGKFSVGSEQLIREERDER
jgi:antitoxin (DNA-binding transcriptional repressor) of toxin-antitoxin stability system